VGFLDGIQEGGEPRELGLLDLLSFYAMVAWLGGRKD